MRELFSFLLLHPDRMHPREILASIIWGRHCTTAQAKTYLRKTLWQLHRVLHGLRIPIADAILETDAACIRMCSHPDLALDCATFETTYAAVSGVPGRNLDAQQVQRVREAVEMYTGPLLPNWYQEWCLFERERLHDLYFIMLGKLMGYCEAHGAYEEGLIYGRRILKHDGAREHTHRGMMRLYYLAGDRIKALRQFAQCEAVLEAELNLRPARCTLELYEQIRRDALAVGADGFVRSETASSPPAEVLLGRLNRLQQGLSDMQRQVQDTIQAMENHLISPDPSVK